MPDNERDPFEIEDPTILTLQEHKLIGSGTLLPKMEQNPFIPQAVLEGKTPKEVAILRIRQREIVSTSASRYFGLGMGEAAVIALNMIDLKTGEVMVPVPRLSGIFYEGTGKFVRDPEILAAHRLSDEGKRMFLVGFEGGRREKIG